ncbi:MAG: hypothetical protein IH884_10025 [Myxococcales bacterium]|nr:hypothetical protein [Myxococcales bacterium]
MPIEPSSEAVRADMRVTLPILLILTVTGAYALGRMSIDAGDPGRKSNPDLASLASFRASLEQSDALERSYRFHGFLQTLSPDEVGEASQVVEAWNPWLVEDELLNFMIAWARFGAPEAFGWARTRTGPFREQASAAALEAWAFHDPVAARRALESVDPPSERLALKEYFIAGWLKGEHHDGVTEYIAAQPPGNARQRYMNLLTIELMRDSPTPWSDGRNPSRTPPRAPTSEWLSRRPRTSWPPWIRSKLLAGSSSISDRAMRRGPRK